MPEYVKTVASVVVANHVIRLVIVTTVLADSLRATETCR